MTSNTLKLQENREKQRNNVATEYETQFHNRNVEYETFRDNSARLQETNRHNVATETYNNLMLAETRRANQMAEYQRAQELAAKAEANRIAAINAENDRLKAQAQQETARANTQNAKSNAIQAGVALQTMPYTQSKLSAETANTATRTVVENRTVGQNEKRLAQDLAESKAREDYYKKQAEAAIIQAHAAQVKSAVDAVAKGIQMAGQIMAVQ
jgi:membrane protein involved in colicin uptake